MPDQEKVVSRLGVRGGSSTLARRGLLAGLTALVAGIAAKTTAQPVQAATGDNFITGAINVATTTTEIQRNGASPALLGTAGLQVTNDNGPAIFGSSADFTALRGDSVNNVGLVGTSNKIDGLIGNALGATGGNGVFGNSSNGTGIRGDGPQFGGSFNAVDNAAGSKATAASVGVSGFSSVGIGVAGSTTSGFAAKFTGPVFISGDFTATGIKSAAVPFGDNSLHRMYCLEFPESYFEDVGSAKLDSSGSAVVNWAGDFSEVAIGTNYHVFLTEYGDLGGLFVESVGANQFTVKSRNGTPNGVFGYRILAHRKDVTSTRLSPVKVPQSLTPNSAPNYIPEPPKQGGSSLPQGGSGRPR